MTETPGMMLWTDSYLGDTLHLTTTEHGAYLLILMAMWRAGGQLPNDELRLARTAKLPLDKWRHIASTIMEFMTIDGDAVSQKRLKLEYDAAIAKHEKFVRAGTAGGKVGSRHAVDTSTGSAETPCQRASTGSAETPCQRASIDDKSLIYMESPPSDASKMLPASLKPGSSTYTKTNKEERKEEGNLTVSCPKRVRTRVTYSDDFEEFWKAYPTDANMGKKEAFEEWQRLSLEDRASAVASCPSFCVYCLDHKDYRPIHANRYLSKRRFDGHLASSVASSSRVYVKVGTKAWSAWEQHWRREKGMPPPLDKRGNGWYFETEWPPACEGPKVVKTA